MNYQSFAAIGKLGVFTLGALALGALVYCDQQVSRAGWWLFVGLSLSIGFTHGALDVVLLAREFNRPRALISVTFLYLIFTLALAAASAQLGWLVLPLLLLMSVWHFGEPYGRWESSDWLARLIAGGAGVMLPALVSSRALQELLVVPFGSDFHLAWNSWKFLAWAWLALCATGWVALRQNKCRSPLFTEVAAVLLMNLVLSPLMAFALYFGIFHAGFHIWRVAMSQTEKKTQNQPWGVMWRAFRLLRQPAILATLAATAGLLIVLGWYLRSDAATPLLNDSLILRWLLVALTAVTAPHMILVSRCAHWLQTGQQPNPKSLHAEL